MGIAAFGFYNGAVNSKPTSIFSGSGAFGASDERIHDAMMRHLEKVLADAGGWIGFERLMTELLYAPGLGYYNRSARVFGTLPQDGSDFVTSPELTPLFGQALSRQVLQGLEVSSTREVWEFGAGSGALAAQLLNALGDAIDRYTIVDVSGVLRARQQVTVETLAPEHAGKLAFVDALPDEMQGVVVGNEVLDAMPVALLFFDGERWWERGVVIQDGELIWSNRETKMTPPVDGPFVPGTVTEVHRQAEGFMRTLANRLKRGSVFLLDYGFTESEYYHPQRDQGTLMCHYQHQADMNPLVGLGEKDITAHVNFTGIALAAQEAGMSVLGYTSQARFLMNCGLLELMQGATFKDVAHGQKLISEHEMGELFKVIGLGVGPFFDALGFSAGDRTHTL